MSLIKRKIKILRSLLVSPYSNVSSTWSLDVPGLRILNSAELTCVLWQQLTGVYQCVCMSSVCVPDLKYSSSNTRPHILHILGCFYQTWTEPDPAPNLSEISFSCSWLDRHSSDWAAIGRHLWHLNCYNRSGSSFSVTVASPETCSCWLRIHTWITWFH